MLSVTNKQTNDGTHLTSSWQFVVVHCDNSDQGTCQPEYLLSGAPLPFLCVCRIELGYIVCFEVLQTKWGEWQAARKVDGQTGGVSTIIL